MSKSMVFQSCWDRATVSQVLTSTMGSLCILLKDTFWCNWGYNPGPLVSESDILLIGCQTTCKHFHVLNTSPPCSPLLYNKTGVYKGIYFCSKTYIHDMLICEMFLKIVISIMYVYMLSLNF